MMAESMFSLAGWVHMEQGLDIYPLQPLRPKVGSGGAGEDTPPLYAPEAGTDPAPFGGLKSGNTLVLFHWWHVAEVVSGCHPRSSLSIPYQAIRDLHPG
jgi:hypothetical protein